MKKVIVTIGSTELLCTDAHSAATLVDCILAIVKQKGYGKDTTWEEDENAEITTRAISDDKVLSLDEPEQARGIVERVAKEKRAADDEMRSELERERTFWKLRAKAHAMGIKDEELRKKLSTVAWYSMAYFTLTTTTTTEEK
ncbi:MAG: hypothetical protein D4S01_00745 [Dehalococcoidia bacterium]|nr:MAG: hypothetical protein D4S01_00745 [Dehalococcoidia bacterium]